MTWTAIVFEFEKGFEMTQTDICLLLLQGPVRTDQKGDEGHSCPSREHRTHAELPEGPGHPATAQGTEVQTDRFHIYYLTWIISQWMIVTLSPLLQLLLCSLYEIYLALEEEMDRNCDHPSVAPIYFPAELARLAAIEEDLEFFFGQDWRKKIVVPAATKRYCHRIRQVLFIALSFFLLFESEWQHR